MVSLSVVINRCYGGFSLSDEAVALFNLRSPGLKLTTGVPHGREINSRYVLRDNPTLVEVVRELGSKRASGPSAQLEVRDVSVSLDIGEDDGKERIVGAIVHGKDYS